MHLDCSLPVNTFEGNCAQCPIKIFSLAHRNKYNLHTYSFLTILSFINIDSTILDLMLFSYFFMVAISGSLAGLNLKNLSHKIPFYSLFHNYWAYKEETGTRGRLYFKVGGYGTWHSVHWVRGEFRKKKTDDLKTFVK